MPNDHVTFLEKHMGHRWTPVSVNESEYGFAGESVHIEPLTSNHLTATHFQSQRMSEKVVTEVCNQLAGFGFKNPEDFTRVDTGQGIVLLFTTQGATRAMENQEFTHATATTPLIGDRGIPTQAPIVHMQTADVLDGLYQITHLHWQNSGIAGFHSMALEPALAERMMQDMRELGVHATSYQATPDKVGLLLNRSDAEDYIHAAHHDRPPLASIVDEQVNYLSKKFPAAIWQRRDNGFVGFGMSSDERNGVIKTLSAKGIVPQQVDVESLEDAPQNGILIHASQLERLVHAEQARNISVAR